MPWWHLDKMILDVYAVTGTTEGRSAAQQHERFSEQPNNSTNEFTMDLFWKGGGYNQDHGFPSKGLETGINLVATPANWTVTARNPHITRVVNNEWFAYNSDEGVWVSKGREWFVPSPAWNCVCDEEYEYEGNPSTL